MAKRQRERKLLHSIRDQLKKGPTQSRTSTHPVKAQWGHIAYPANQSRSEKVPSKSEPPLGQVPFQSEPLLGPKYLLNLHSARTSTIPIRLPLGHKPSKFSTTPSRNPAQQAETQPRQQWIFVTDLHPDVLGRFSSLGGCRADPFQSSGMNPWGIHVC